MQMREYSLGSKIADIICLNLDVSHVSGHVANNRSSNKSVANDNICYIFI
jgi:hypothetical protein